MKFHHRIQKVTLSMLQLNNNFKIKKLKTIVACFYIKKEP